MSVSRSDASPPRDLKPLYVVAWLLCALFYLYQYAMRSAPGVTQDQLTAAWGGNHIGTEPTSVWPNSRTLRND
jgi:hypothetical protein